MHSPKTRFYWKNPPDRDEALRVIHSFLLALSNKDIKAADNLIAVKDMDFFLNMLHESLVKYLDLVVEDEELAGLSDLNLAMELDDQDTLDEDITLPAFTGKKFVLEINEEVSLQVGLRGRVTPIRLHFALQEADELYYLKLQRITAR